MVVLDTHALVWWTLDPARLSAPAKRLCEQIPDQGAKISAISIWEIGIKIKRGQLELGIELNDYVRRLRTLKGLEIVPADVEQWLGNLNLPWEHRDPADRTIVATAQLLDLPLISKDLDIRAYYPKTIW
jgi:PIN domain nuclease of toxin-antitoxin system